MTLTVVRPCYTSVQLSSEMGVQPSAEQSFQQSKGMVGKRLHDDVLQRPNKLFTFAAFFIKEVTMKTAEERYEETWNSYLELLSKDPRASLVSFTKLKSVYYRGMTKWMSHNGLSVYDAKAKIRECHRKSLSGEPVTCNTTSMFLPVTADETASGNPMSDADLLSGVSLTFPDGTIVNIKRGSAKALVSFLSLYRKGGEPCLG